jgi:hypothetical protein
VKAHSLATLVLIASLAGPTCASVHAGPEPSPTASGFGRDSRLSFVPTGIVGRWRFDRVTGVPPRELPPGAVPDNREDLVIALDGTFTWGAWSGTASGAAGRFALVVTDPPELAERFADYAASIVVVVGRDGMRIWLPDLGQDRDVDIGSAGEDIDAPDMAFEHA